MDDLATTIRNITRQHLTENNGCLLAQCVTAVGWIANTVPNDIPDHKGIIELPTSDSSNGGIACGLALMGKRPIYVVRYQGFMWYNAVSILNYAAKSKEMWNQPCPVFVRGIGMEGGMGPVASHMNHSIMCHMPGIKVYSPMTSMEYEEVWKEFMCGDDPVYCSEHRLSYKTQDYTYPHFVNTDNDVLILYVGGARLRAVEVSNRLDEMGVEASHVHLYQLKPFRYPEYVEELAEKAKLVLVVDSDYATCGISEHIASYFNGKAIGLQDKAAGFSKDTDVQTPTADEIINYIMENL